jgi:hypothetical protein
LPEILINNFTLPTQWYAENKPEGERQNLFSELSFLFSIFYFVSKNSGICHILNLGWICKFVSPFYGIFRQYLGQ